MNHIEFCRVFKRGTHYIQIYKWSKMHFTDQYFIKTNIRPQIRDLKVTHFHLDTLQHISPENRNMFSKE